MLSAPRCPVCNAPTMYPLARFYEDDVNEKAYTDTYVPHRAFGCFFPGTSLVIMFVSWLISLVGGKSGIKANRAKVRAAREQILPRAPRSFICPSCFHVEERI